MKTKNTEAQLTALAKALEETGERLFRTNYRSNAKYEAQSHLIGKTHYVDDDTLRFHHGRISSCAVLCGGLVLKLHCTDALDMHNTKRGHRIVLFDIFGDTIWRPELEQATATAKQAEKFFESVELDIVKHYGDVLSRRMSEARSNVAAIELAMDRVSAV